jgi:microcin C transport system permease protein
MIESRIRNEVTLKKYRRFKRQRRAVISVWILLILCSFSFTAELWSNSKPLAMSYRGNLYFPVLKKYHPNTFGRFDIYEMDYRWLNFANGDWVLWPINRWDPLETNKNLASYPGKPSIENILGTDDRGRDVFARLLYGFRYSFIFAVLTWFFSFTVGTAAGAVMGYFGGAVDMIGQRVVEVFLTIPTLLLLITIISIFAPSMFLLVAFMVIFDWTTISLYVRGEFLRLRRREFTEAARALGGSRARIIFQHILPNGLGPVITFSPLAISANIVALANLDYLGLGLRPPTPSWGELLNQARQYFTVAWWLAVYPSIALVVTLIVMNLIGDSIRTALDPRKT